MKKPKRQPFDSYWKKRPGGNYCSKREAKYWFLLGVQKENAHMNQCWERNKQLKDLVHHQGSK